jgi:hypothetical protein
MDEVDNTTYIIPTSSLAPQVAAGYIDNPAPAPKATVAPSNTNVAQPVNSAAAAVNVSPKNPQTANIQNIAQSETLNYSAIYNELSSASEEIIECRKNRLSNVF